MGFDKINRYCELFKWLKNSKPSQTKTFIKVADKNIINALCECSLKVLRGDVSLSKKQKQKLKKYKRNLRQLTDKKLSLKRKKSLLQSKGGGLLGVVLRQLADEKNKPKSLLGVVLRQVADKKKYGGF